jgi:hypothetical protein
MVAKSKGDGGKGWQEDFGLWGVRRVRQQRVVSLA